MRKELPPKTEQVLACLLTPQQERRYIEYLHGEQVQAALAGRVMPFKAIVRLRQICNHPAFFRANESGSSEQVVLRHTDGMFYKEESMNEEETLDLSTVDWHDSGKLLVLNELLPLWQKEGHKVLLYTQTVSMLNIIELFLSTHVFSTP